MDISNLWSGYDLDSKKQNNRCLAVNTILEGKYLVGPVLGQGGFGITYVGYDLNMETKIAIKEYFPVELVSRDTTTMHGDRVLSLGGEKSVTYQQGLKKYVAEAQNVSQFSEVPGVVSVKDFFYANETAYIVMEFIDGISLKDYLKEQGGRLSEEETLKIMKPVLEALAQVHKAGIIHRDISPDNIMLTFEDAVDSGVSKNADARSAGSRKIQSVKLIDFGAARMTAKNDQKSLTIILKHGYAPEEQYRTHGEQGPWTDVYAICATMYRMLTGETPVPAMDRLFQDELKSFDALGVKVSRNTADAILKGLAVKKDDRIQSMQELLGALYEGAKLRGNGSRDKKQRLRLAAMGVVAAAAVLAIGLAVWSANQVGSGKESVAALEAQQEPEGVKPAEADLKRIGSMESDANGVEAAKANQGENLLSIDTEEEEFGEVIVTATPQTSYDGSAFHVVILKEDGTVTSLGSNQYGQRNLSEWSRIAAVAAGDTFSAGLREDGKVLVEGELKGKEEVERWENIIAISAADSRLYGLTSDKTIVASSVDKGNSACLEWTNVKSVSAAPYTVSALTEDGQVFTAASFSEPAEIRGWNDVKWIVCNQRQVFGVREDGTVVHSNMWADPKYHGEQSTDGIENFQNISQLYVDHVSFYGVTEDGQVRIGGQMYQKIKQIGHYASSTPGPVEMEVSGWSDLTGIVGTAWGEGRLAGIGKDGTIRKAVQNYGDLENLTNLEKITVFDTERGPVFIGITKEHRVLCAGAGTNDRILKEREVPVKEVMNLRYYDTENSTFGGFAVLDAEGNLTIEKYWDSFGDLVQAETSLVQAACVPGERGKYSYIAGLTENGTIKLCETGYNGIPEVLHRAEEWTGIKEIAICDSRTYDLSYLLGVKTDGTVEAIGSDGTVPEAVAEWTDIVSLHAGTYAIGAIRRDGTAVFLEDAPEQNRGQYNTSGWTDLTQLALGAYHTVGLRSDGTVYAVGRNDAGQCDVEDWTDIVYIAAGDCCTLGIKSDGTLVTAGEVGW